MKYFLMTLVVIAYILASVAYFYWGWNVLKDGGLVRLCGCMAFLILAYTVVTMFLSIAFENIFDIDLGW